MCGGMTGPILLSGPKLVKGLACETMTRYCLHRVVVGMRRHKKFVRFLSGIHSINFKPTLNVYLANSYM